MLLRGMLMNYLVTGIDMKLLQRISILFLSAILSAFSSCIDKGDGSLARWELLNVSGHSIVISVYSNSMLIKTIDLETNGADWKTPDYSNSGISKNFPPIDSALEGDSIRIEFDNERIIINKFPYNASDSLSIYNPNNYKIILEDKLSIYRYTFTEADYENAEPIGE